MTSRRRTWRRLTTAPFIAAIRVYQLTLSAWMGRQCRFVPTCSWYALEAYREHGAGRGTALTLRRLARCHPVRFLGGAQGYDPVPPAEPPPSEPTLTSTTGHRGPGQTDGRPAGTACSREGREPP